MVSDQENDVHEGPLDAYLALIKTKGVPTREINLRKHFLRHLVSMLEGLPLNGDLYREVVDQVLRKFPDDAASQEIFKTAAREFYNFWICDTKSLAKLTQAALVNEEPIHIHAAGSLSDLLAEMDRARSWVCTDWAAIERYLQQLYATGLAKAAIDVRERLLRLLMYVSREYPSSPRVYRAAVDAMLPLFTTPEGQQVFVSLAREFYYFWLQDPAAGIKHDSAPGQMNGNNQLAF
ncbi:hypothetical protein [Chitinivorax sp. B]|uniref:hypothetical protein n=1 Tax=Chitinivorax sp. B TaxID=2502235 RepID=UPI0010F96E14|nr:hypothetical protein [Chitinivorax sp. B]